MIRATRVASLLIVRPILQVGVVILFTFGGAVNADEVLDRSARIKAAVVYQAFRFIRWPQIDSSESGPIGVCILGKGTLSEQVTKVLWGKLVQNHNIVPVRVTSPFEIPETCNAIFLDKGEIGIETIRKILTIAKQRSLITVCHGEALVWSGCAIEIFEEDNKAGIGIDLRVVKEVGFSIGSELLALAKIKGD